MNKNRNNVVMIVYSHYSRDARVRKYAELLAAKNYQIDIICLKEKYTPKQKNIRLIFYPFDRRRFNRLWYLLEYMLFCLYSFFFLTFSFIQKRYYLVHVHNMPDFLVFTAILPKLMGSRIILDMHDPMPEVFISKYRVNENNFILKLIKITERTAFNFADTVITANQNFKKIFLRRYPLLKNKMFVIQNFPDENIFKKNKTILPGKNFILMYMGTVEERYDLLPAVKAMEKLRLVIPEIRFNIFPKIKSEGKFYNKLREEILINHLGKYVKILPPLPVEKIASEINKIDVGILLLKRDLFTENIIPVKLLEFISLNKPVIATRTRSLSKIFTDKEIYFLENNNAEEFTVAVLKLYRNKKLADRLSVKARQFLISNNWKKESGKYLKLVHA